MKFWAIVDGYCEYEYKEENHKSDCEICKSSPTGDRCSKGYLNISKNKNSVNLQFCFEKTLPKKQSKYIADICADGYNRQSVMLADIRKRNLQFSEVANHNIMNLVSGMGLKLGEIFPLNSSDSEAKHKTIISALRTQQDLVSQHLLSFEKAILQIENERLIISLMERSIKPSKSNLTKHPIHAIALISRYLNEDLLSENNIRINMGACYSEVLVEFSAALSSFSQIFSNAAKYCAPNSIIDLVFRERDSYMDVEFSMTSLKIDKLEIDKLRQLGFRGQNSEGIPGHGIGLYAVSEMMRICFGSFQISAGEKDIQNDGNIYAKNTFTLRFQTSKSMVKCL